MPTVDPTASDPAVEMQCPACGAMVQSRLQDQAVIDELRKQGWAPPIEESVDIVEAVAKALHDYEHGGAQWHTWKDINDFGRNYWTLRADVAIRAHYAAHHTPYAVEEHQGGNLLDLYLKTFAELFRLKNEVLSSAVTREQVRKAAEAMWDLADKHRNWQHSMELAFASAGIEVRDA